MGSLPSVLQGQRTHTAPPCSAALRVSAPFPGSQALCSGTALCLLRGTCVQSFVGSAARTLLFLPLITLPDQLAPSGTWHLNYFPLFSGSRNCNPVASRPLPPREEEVQRGL